jgi:hypothetical protein
VKLFSVMCVGFLSVFSSSSHLLSTKKYKKSQIVDYQLFEKHKKKLEDCNFRCCSILFNFKSFSLSFLPFIRCSCSIHLIAVFLGTIISEFCCFLQFSPTQNDVNKFYFLLANQYKHHHIAHHIRKIFQVQFFISCR